MKKTLFSILLCLILTSVSFCSIIFYEDKDWKVGITDITSASFYDIKNNEWAAGVFTTPVQYKIINLDAGIIDNLSDIGVDNLPNPFLGLSSDIDPLNALVKKLISTVYKNITHKEIDLDNSNITTNIGAYGSYNLRETKWGYGVYTGLKFKF